MRIELANDQWIEVRDKIKGGDIFAVNEAAEVPLNEEGRAERMSFRKLDDDRFIALSQRLITGWSFQVPLTQTFEQMKALLSDLDVDDLNKFRAGMQPLMDKVLGNIDLPDPKTPEDSSSSS